MGDGLNRVTLIGNLGVDPRLTVVAGGQAKLAFRLATTETYLDRASVRRERTEWHGVEVWGKRAEALAKILAKGTRIYVEGPLRYSSWTPEVTVQLDDQGRCPHCAQSPRRTATFLTTENVVLLSKRERGDRGGEPRAEGPPLRDPDDPGPEPPLF